MGVKRSVFVVVRGKRWVVTGCRATGKALMDWLNDDTGLCGGSEVPGPIVLYTGKGQASRKSWLTNSLHDTRSRCPISPAEQSRIWVPVPAEVVSKARVEQAANGLP
jgi:hypothetical protein